MGRFRLENDGGLFFLNTGLKKTYIYIYIAYDTSGEQRVDGLIGMCGMSPYCLQNNDPIVFRTIGII